MQFFTLVPYISKKLSTKGIVIIKKDNSRLDTGGTDIYYIRFMNVICFIISSMPLVSLNLLQNDLYETAIRQNVNPRKWWRQESYFNFQEYQFTHIWNNQ